MDPDEQSRPDVKIGHARLDDAAGIAAVHVAVWRTAYPGVLPDHTLTGLSGQSLAHRYAAMISVGAGVLVARVPGATQGEPGIVGYTSASRNRSGIVGLGEGEVETLYVLDDWRDQGIGRSLLQAAARHLVGLSCRSMFLWVLADNPSRWFYERLGGRPAMRSTTRVGGQSLPQIAMVWDKIEVLSGRK